MAFQHVSWENKRKKKVLKGDLTNQTLPEECLTQKSKKIVQWTKFTRWVAFHVPPLLSQPTASRKCIDKEKESYEIRSFPKNFFLAAPWIKVTSLQYFKFWRLAESPWEWIFQLLWSGGSVGWFKIHINDNLRQLTYIYSGYNANFSSGFLVCKRIISIFQSLSRRKRYVC